MAVQFAESMQIQEDVYGIDVEEVRQIVGETSPTLLIVTLTVSLLHTLFAWLAFVNDVQFWHQQQNRMEGISARSVLLSAVSEVILFLYLVHEKASRLVLLSAGIGVGIELWKITKAYQITVPN